MLKIRRSRDRLIFNMGIPILVRRHLNIETVPRLWTQKGHPISCPSPSQVSYGVSFVWTSDKNDCVMKRFDNYHCTVQATHHWDLLVLMTPGSARGSVGDASGHLCNISSTCHQRRYFHKNHSHCDTIWDPCSGSLHYVPSTSWPSSREIS